MYELFTKVEWGRDNVRTPSTVDYLQRSYRRQVDAVVEYYHSRVYAVKSNHLLCRLINTMNAPVDYDVDRYMEIMFARAPFVARHFDNPVS